VFVCLSVSVLDSKHIMMCTSIARVYYSASGAGRCNSHGLTVCLSVCHILVLVQTNEDTIMQCSASGSTVILVSKEVKFIWLVAWGHPPPQAVSDY